MFASATDVADGLDSGVSKLLRSDLVANTEFAKLLKDPAFPGTFLLPKLPGQAEFNLTNSTQLYWDHLLSYHVIPWPVLLNTSTLPLVARTELSSVEQRELCEEELGL